MKETSKQINFILEELKITNNIQEKLYIIVLFIYKSECLISYTVIWEPIVTLFNHKLNYGFKNEVFWASHNIWENIYIYIRKTHLFHVFY